MSRGERAAIAVGFGLLAGFLVLLANGTIDRVGSHSWFSNGANVVQWLSAPATFIAVAVASTAWLNRACAAKPWCVRHGEHPVDGTLKKVCTHHHTLEHHRAVFARHGPAHSASGRLDRGESHQGGRRH